MTLPRWTADRWVGDFDEAEHRADESGGEMLICYNESRPGKESALQGLLTAEALSGFAEDKVRCSLSRSYEPDRRFVAQFGVSHAPALVLVHGDGTYHAYSGAMTNDRIAEFFTSAKPPGASPTINPYLPRRADYRWHESIEEAQAEADRTGRPALIVYYRKLSRDWARLNRLLQRHEVYSRLSGTIHCRVGLLSIAQKTDVTRYGSLHLPALVIVQTDGAYDVLELPTTYESIVHFADRVLPVDRANHTETASGTAGNESTQP